jgi:hypothetical protein
MWQLQRALIVRELNRHDGWGVLQKGTSARGGDSLCRHPASQQPQDITIEQRLLHCFWMSTPSLEIHLLPVHFPFHFLCVFFTHSART